MRIFSGIQPSGSVHLGNYLGAIKNWHKLAENNEAIFCVVDYHAITVDYNEKEMPQKVTDAVKDILAAGITQENATIFLQSDVSEHTELAWLLNTITTMGELGRMTQYKEKTQKNGTNSERVGLFDYPVLMAADILLYKAEGVPVGEDQTQHVELARDLARRFNSRFGKTFFEPKLLLSDVKRVMSLQSESKMSKSDNPNSYIALSDSPDLIRKKIASAVTDNGTDNTISTNTLNLIKLYGELVGKDAGEKLLDQRKMGLIKYSEFKPALADAIIKVLEPFQKRRAEISDEEVKKVLKIGAEKLRPAALETMKEVKRKMGLII